MVPWKVPLLGDIPVIGELLFRQDAFFYLAVVLGVLPLLQAGSEEQKRLWLPRIASGQTMLTLALTEPEAD